MKFFAKPYPFAVFPSLSRDLKATELYLSSTHYGRTHFFFLGLRCFGFAQHDNMRGFVKRFLASSTNIKIGLANSDLAFRHEGSCVKKTRILPVNSGQKLSELEERVFLAATIIRVFS